MGKFILKKRVNGEFQFNLEANNYEVILKSEGYTSKAGALNGIDSVRTHAPHDKNYERRRSSNDKYYFNLKASNGQVIGTSEMYENESGRENGIESVKNNAPGATIDDQT